MGQRSQIYVRATMTDGEASLIARYYQWNYGERMISRARGAMEHIENRMDDYYWRDGWEKEKMARLLDVNFDMRDIVMSADIIAEYHEWGKGSDFNDYVFLGQDNNDGKLLIDVDVKNRTIKYAFLDSEASLDHIMNGEEYMSWNLVDKYEGEYEEEDQAPRDWREELASFQSDPQEGKEILETCEDNIKEISSMATLMTREEVEKFLSFDYEKSKGKGKNDQPLDR